MNRRHVLLSAAAGAALAGNAPSAVGSTGTPRPNSGQPLQGRDGVRLFHRSWGEGRPVLFVHAWALNGDMWSYQVVHLSDRGLRCITYDRRGHGRSDPPIGPFDLNTLADDLASVIEGLDLHDLVLVGHSAGANEVVRYLGRYGTDRIAKIALLAPTTPFALKTEDNPNGAPEAYFEQFRSAIAKDYPQWIED